MPQFAYLLAILVSLAGMVVIDRRWSLGVLGRRLLITVLVVEGAFLLVFDGIGAARGWFASNPELVSAIVPPGIPPEEPLLLAFLAFFSVIVYRVAGRLTGEDPVAPSGRSEGTGPSPLQADGDEGRADA
jgi:lycopene cyclase domain-containing protein